MTGSEIPYFFGNDNLLVSLFLLAALGIAYVFVLNGGSIMQRLKNLFYHTGNSKPYNSQTHINRFCNIILYAQAVIFTSIIAFAATMHGKDAAHIDSPHIYSCAYIAAATLFIIVKHIIYTAVNRILFSNQQAKEWDELYFFTIQIFGLLQLPLVTATLTTPHIPRSIYIGYIATTAFICLIMLITGCKKIIFRQNDRFIDIILYLCTLEILPIAVSVKAIHELNILITINC